MDECKFCSGRAVKAEYCGNGTKTVEMMLEMMVGLGEERERDYAYNGILLKNGSALFFDNSAAEYADLGIEINCCPFCGRKLTPSEVT